MTEIKIVNDMEVELIQKMGGDNMVIAAARVSTAGDASKDFIAEDADEGKGLIRFLMRNRHGTPFEHNSLTFFVRAPIFVFREFHRHRIGWSYNEESGRYKQLDPIFYLPYEGRKLKQVGKPGHYQYVPGDEFDEMLVKQVHGHVLKAAYEGYEQLLENGIAKEVARMTLPVNICSSMYATCNARSLMAFLSLRTAREAYWQQHPAGIGWEKHPGGAVFPSSPQREIEMVAEKMEAIFAEHFPITYAAWNDFGRVTP